MKPKLICLSQSLVFLLDSTLEVKFEQFQWTVFQKSLGNLKKKTKNVLPSEEVNIFFYGNCRRDNENIFFLEILMIVTPSSSYAVCWIPQTTHLSSWKIHSTFVRIFPNFSGEHCYSFLFSCIHTLDIISFHEVVSIYYIYAMWVSCDILVGN